MRKIIVAVSAILLGLSACSFKGEHIEPLSEQEADRVLNAYYQQPDSEKLVRALAYVDESDKLNEGGRAFIGGILFGLSSENRPEWKIISHDIVWEKGMIPVMQSLKNMPDSTTLSNRIIGNKDMVVSTAPDLDFLWGAFSATGNPKFVQVIIRTKNSVEVNPVVRSSAVWSLYSQSKQHPIVERELKNAPAAPDEFMQKIEAKFQNPA